jgi:hypothetical protein
MAAKKKAPGKAKKTKSGIVSRVAAAVGIKTAKKPRAKAASSPPRRKTKGAPVAPTAAIELTPSDLASIDRGWDVPSSAALARIGPTRGTIAGRTDSTGKATGKRPRMASKKTERKKAKAGIAKRATAAVKGFFSGKKSPGKRGGSKGGSTSLARVGVPTPTGTIEMHTAKLGKDGVWEVVAPPRGHASHLAPSRAAGKSESMIPGMKGKGKLLMTMVHGAEVVAGSVVGYELQTQEPVTIPLINQRWRRGTLATLAGLLLSVFLRTRKNPYMKAAARHVFITSCGIGAGAGVEAYRVGKDNMIAAGGGGGGSST